MKRILLNTIILTYIPLANAHVLWEEMKSVGMLTCQSRSFPSSFDAKIYLRDGRFLIGQLYLEVLNPNEPYYAIDGDKHYEAKIVRDDIIQFRLEKNSEDEMQFVQTDETAPQEHFRITNVSKHGVSKGTTISISSVIDPKPPYHKDVYYVAKIKAEKGPAGEPAEDTLYCW
jgi:hypothetical protein